MNILSVFISSNKVYFHFIFSEKEILDSFAFYPFFQSESDLDYLISSFLKSFKLIPEDVQIILVSTVFNIPVFKKRVNYLNNILENTDFTYIYLDNLTLYSKDSVSLSSFGLSTRSDNYISNRSKFSANKFTGDLEELVYLSKSINQNIFPKTQKVVFGGDYFNDLSIPNEFKLNFISEILSDGFYEVYLDSKNQYPNFINLRKNSSINLKSPNFEKFCYLLTSNKTHELLLQSKDSRKYLNIKENETFFLHLLADSSFELSLKVKGRVIKNLQLNLNNNFPGILFDFRLKNHKNTNIGIESLRKVLDSIERENDYSSL